MVAWTIGTTPAWAGGHFDVDDAAMLDPGQCQVEAWGGRVGEEHARLAHLGSACRVGPVELGVNFERVALPGDSAVALGPQLKWIFFGPQEDAPLSAGLLVNAVADVTHGGRWGGQWLLPLTWRPLDSLQIHANLGVDWTPGDGRRTGRAGLGAEWVATDKLTLIAERLRACDSWITRLGLRYGLAPATSIDLGVGRISPAHANSVVIGLNHVFGR